MSNLLTTKEVRNLYQVKYRAENKELLKERRKAYHFRIKNYKKTKTYRDYRNSIEKRPGIFWIIPPDVKTYKKTPSLESANAYHTVSPDIPLYYLEEGL
tara:strand:+ start:219 stop:515 length:297 start_codon:yes stop_codon:yes gene_type:complete